MKITRKDIGRRVVDGRGEVETIIKFVEGLQYPVITDASEYTEDGVFSLDCPSIRMSLVRFLDEEIELITLMFIDLLKLSGEL